MKEIMNDTMELTMDGLELVNGGCRIDDNDGDVVKPRRISDEDLKEIMKNIESEIRIRKNMWNGILGF